jgi:3-phosphoshikimate 1-carboxyvinyltransferase
MSGQPTFKISPGVYTSPKELLVEGDASSASYFLAGAAITGGTVKVVGCGSASVQGDVKFADCLEEVSIGQRWPGDRSVASEERSDE